MSLDPNDVLDVEYGLEGAVVEPLSGGVVNRVWSVQAASGRYALKQYSEPVSIEQMRQSIRAINVAGADGLPVPAVFPDRSGDVVCVLSSGVYVLSELLPGRLYEPDQMPAPAARSMGVALGRLHDALASLPAGKPKPLPSLATIEGELRSLLALARSRTGDAVDEIAAGVLEARLDLLGKIDRVPVLPAQWTHGDFEWRNVLFDANDEVAGIIDFDDAQHFSPARDVMRCIALSFASLGPEADQFVAGYASVRALSPAEVRGYVEFYRYLSTFRVWPLVNRYRYPERYRPEWDALIQPFFPWDWTALSERLAEVAAGASQR